MYRKFLNVGSSSEGNGAGTIEGPLSTVETSQPQPGANQSGELLKSELPIDGPADRFTPPAGMTLGEFLVNPAFNPGNNGQVKQLKQIYSDLINLIHSMPINHEHPKAAWAQKWKEESIDGLVNNQMLAVKAVTATV